MWVAKVLALYITVTNVAVHGIALYGLEHHSAASLVVRQGNQTQIPEIHGTRNMSYEAAVQALAHNDAVQAVAALIEKSHKRHRSSAHHQKSALRASQESSQTPSGTTQDAEAMLNTVILETVKNLDIEKVGCRDFHISQSKEMQLTHNELSEASERAAAARAEILRAESSISNLKTLIDDAKTAIKEEKDKGKQEIDALQSQMSLVDADLEVMEKVIGLTQCNGQSLDTALLQCKQDEAADNSENEGHSFLMFRATHLRKAMASLRSATARQNLQKHFPHHITHSGHHRAILLRHAEKHRHHGRRLLHRHRHHARQRAEEESSSDSRRDSSAALQRLEQEIRKESRSESGRERSEGESDTATAGGPGDEDEEYRRNCNIDSSPACGDIKDKFLAMDAELMEKKNDLKRKIQDRREAMKSQVSNLKEQIDGYTYQLGEEETALAQGTAQLNTAEGQMRLKQQQYRALSRDFNKALAGCKLTESGIECDTSEGAEMVGSCGTNIQKFETEICGIQKVRQELAKLANARRQPITDCQVSEWIPMSDCTVSCGGGKQTLSRTVTWYPHSGGAACPPLQMEKSCNPEPCPIDCVVDDWSEWSACSASCDTGVKQRSRGVRVEAAHGGEACGELSEAENCHMEACDQDCVLGDWSDWGSCDKGCGGGFQRATRSVIKPAVGLGRCWEPDDDARTLWQSCNPQPCAAGLVCESKMDVVLVLDTSGSVGSAGWTATKNAANQIIEAFERGNADAKIAVLVYSGPSSYSTQRQCFGWSSPSSGFDMERDCRMNWVSHLSSDYGQVKTAVSALGHAGGNTMTSLALKMARDELSWGRHDAQATVVVVTDGYPLSWWNTYVESWYVRQVARLMWVAVGAGAPLDWMHYWASQPTASNVIGVQDFSSLDSSNTVDLIVADMCPKVGTN
mmetsp:Transcript_56612/g.134856  ORF Transcript_56612/g.134856 Transcript_56612/m.134856 type:complete len:917 (-) Transcript_56612:182-2932(-)